MGNSSKHIDDSVEPASATVLSSSSFGSVITDMAWKIAVATLGISLGGIGLDKMFNTSPLFSIFGIVLAVVIANIIALKSVGLVGGRK